MTTPENPLLEVRNLSKTFLAATGTFGRPAGRIHAADGISFDVFRGEAVGIVGESGCGKSTLARLIVRLVEPDSGQVLLDGVPAERELRRFRSRVQMVFQDSHSTLNPRMSVESSIAFGPLVHGAERRAAIARARAILEQVGLEPGVFGANYPHELSGGQRQRVNIARALAVGPRLVILDEAVSALDKSVEAQILNLLVDLKSGLGLTYLFISHDLHVVRYLCGRVLVMYLGQVVEAGSAEEIYSNPRHPYTRALLSALPSGDPDRRSSAAPIEGDPPSAIDPPPGCRFRTRCPHAREACGASTPELLPAGGDGLHRVACHRWKELVPWRGSGRLAHPVVSR